MPVVQLINPNTGQVFDVDESEAGEAAATANLRAATAEEVEQYDLQKSSGGLGGRALAAASAVPATITDTAQGLLQLKYPGMERPTNEALANLENPPVGFSQAEQDARRANPLSAAAGGLATDVAAGLAVPGAGLGGLAGRALAAGAVTEGFDVATEAVKHPDISPEYSVTDALAYAGVAGLLEGGALAAVGVLRGLLRKGQRAPDPINAGTATARAEALEQVLKEPPGPQWSAKVAAFGPDAVEEVQRRAVQGVTRAEEAFTEATENLMGAAALRKAIPINGKAQERTLIEVAGAIRSAADGGLSGTKSGQRLREIAEDVIGQTKREEMYRAVTRAADEIEELGLPSNQLTDALRRQVADAASDKSTWGRAVDHYRVSRSIGSSADDLDDAVRTAMSEGPEGARRVTLDQRLDAMADAAQTTRNEPLAKAVNAARSSLESASGLQGKVGMGDLAEDLTSRALKAGMGPIAEGLTQRILKVGVLEKTARYGMDAVGFGVGGLPGALAVDFLADRAAPHVVRAGKAVISGGGRAVAPAIRQGAERAKGAAARAGRAIDESLQGTVGGVSKKKVAVAVGAGGVATLVAAEANAKADQYRQDIELLRGVRLHSVAGAARSLVDAGYASSQSTVGKYASVGTMSAGVAHFLGPDGTARQAFERRRKELETLSRDPMALIDHLEETMADLGDVAPGLRDAMAAQTFRALSFVRSKMPETVGVSMAHPSGIPPSKLAIRTFALYYSAALQPRTVIEDTRNNRVRHEQIEALREVWPELYQELSAETLAQMSVSRPSVKQRVRMDLLFGFGPALDAAFSPDLAALAARGASERESEQAAPGARMPQRQTQRSIQATAPAGLAALDNRVN